ncbi:MAG: histidinol-phosphate transaminase [Bacteroidales bacterium]|nr:histidinol-phosphate transaminase [Bacteroidales bacterium]
MESIRKAIEFVHPYVPGKTIDEVKTAYGLEEVIKLGSNENPYGPFENAKEAMIKEIDQIFMYPDYEYEKLKEILAHKNYLKPSNVTLSHGAGGVLETLAKAFIEEGDEVIIPTQTYGLYREISIVMGANVIESPLNENYTIDIEDIVAKCTDKTKLIWLCNPNNPTGTMFGEVEFESLLERMPGNTWIVMDEAYIEFSNLAKRIDTIKYIKQRKNVIVVRTMSKAYGLAGARIGYSFANEEMIRIIDTVAEPFNANRIGLAGAIATLTKDQEIYESRLQAITDERKNMSRELTDMGMICIPSETNFVFFETGLNASDIGEELLKRGIIVRPCTGWGYQEAIRVTVGTKYENKRFLEEFKTLISKSFDRGSRS